MPTKKRTTFGDLMTNTMKKIPSEEVVWIGGDLNGHVGDNNHGTSEMLSKYGSALETKGRTNPAIRSDQQDGDPKHLLLQEQRQKVYVQQRKEQYTDRLYSVFSVEGIICMAKSSPEKA